MKKLKNLLVLLVTVSILTSYMALPTHAKSTVKIIINGVTVNFTQKTGYPFVDSKGRIQVPFRAAVESFGAEVFWNKEKQMAGAKFNDIVVYTPINKDYIIVNDQQVKNDTKSIVSGGRIYCPIRKVLEAFKAKVSWDGKQNAVVVTYFYNDPTSGYNKINYDEKVMPQLTILVNFTDVKLKTTEAQWQDFWYDSTNSVSKYYSDMSNGNLTIVGANETSGTKNNGIIQVSLISEHPDSANKPFYDLAFYKSVIGSATKYIDFSQYDVNSDDILVSSELAITVIAAGYEESGYLTENEKAVSGIQFTTAEYVVADNVNLSPYTLIGEIFPQDYDDESMSTIGVVTHEFAHLVGLPDLYDLDYSSVGLGFHTLMSDSSGYNDETKMGEYPATLDAWSRMYSGMIMPGFVSEPGTYRVYGDIANYNILIVPTSDPGIYYMLENRQISGYGRTWDLYMDYGGIAIWRIDEKVIDANVFNNTVNDDDTARGVSLIEAGGTNDLQMSSLDYTVNRYNHYFSRNGENFTYLSPEGILFTVESLSGDAMDVTISLQ